MQPPSPPLGPMGGKGGKGIPLFFEKRKVNPDAGVMATNDAATGSKVRAVHLGYYTDPYITKVSKMTASGIGGESPLVRRGYWARVRFVQRCIENFCAKHSTGFQVLSVGCGYDSTYFRLKDSLEGLVRWVDVDLPQVVAVKKRNIEDPTLQPLVEDTYHLLAHDLREPGLLKALVEQCKMNTAIPTLCISECVLVYLQAHEGDAVLQSLAASFETISAVTYEQVNPTTPFGQKMITNLQARGCPLLSYAAYPDLASQVARYRAAGFETATAKDMNAVWASLPEGDRRRVAKLEILDELEEWVLIHSHYSFICASKGTPGWDADAFCDNQRCGP